MTFFPFVDPNRRPQAKIKKMTEKLTKKFQAIDPDLTLINIMITLVITVHEVFPINIEDRLGTPVY
ncbi:hypothetical protein [Enterococcus mundtii]|uniref:hypothetical protein n=1 Tax=Enterococcus mundtii TaxID=53346 RepID=UPI0035C06656